MNIHIDGIEKTSAMFDNFAIKIAEKLPSGLALGGKIVEGEAKALCPVSTDKTRPGGPHGELRQSITSQVEGNVCTVGTAKNYAPYVEFGTRYMSAQPYLVPALKNKENEVIQAIKESLK